MRITRIPTGFPGIRKTMWALAINHLFSTTTTWLFRIHWKPHQYPPVKSTAQKDPKRSALDGVQMKGRHIFLGANFTDGFWPQYAPFLGLVSTVFCFDPHWSKICTTMAFLSADQSSKHLIFWRNIANIHIQIV